MIGDHHQHDYDHNEAPEMRMFESGAVRDTDKGKPDYEAFLSPLVLERYGEYMMQCQTLKDGSTREGDDWQKGMEKSVYIKSGWRHFMDWWKEHRKPSPQAHIVEDALCGLLFNVMGYLHEQIMYTKKKRTRTDS